MATNNRNGTDLAALLPDAFSLLMRDSAMEPRWPAGTVCHFKGDIDPVPGRPVLVTDRAGDTFIRIYREATESRGWYVEPTNPRYMALDSQIEGLQVLAVMTGFDFAHRLTANVHADRKEAAARRIAEAAVAAPGSAGRRRELRRLYKRAVFEAETAIVSPGFKAMQYRVFYLVEGRERKTAWFRSEDRARAAFDLMRGRGHQAIIYCD